jgi:hypothetical protein
MGTTGLGVAVGTRRHMAPEEAAAGPATDHRADLFALRLIAHEARARGEGERDHCAGRVTRVCGCVREHGRARMARAPHGAPPAARRNSLGAVHRGRVRASPT